MVDPHLGVRNAALRRPRATDAHWRATIAEFPRAGAPRILLPPTPMSFTQIAGILPAIVFPAATSLQLLRILRSRSTAGVHVPTWFLFGLANVAIYIYAERYSEWQAIIGMLLTAVLDFVIVGLALWANRKRTGALNLKPAAL